MLEMDGGRAVVGADRPAVVGDVNVRPARGDHGLDCDRHTFRESWAAAWQAKVRYVGILVVMATDTVADEAAHDRESCRFDDDLHCVRHVADTVPELRLLDARS